MKKNFPLKASGKEDARVRDKIRHEVNKYVRRERQKPVPEGFALWVFNCKVGASESAAETKPLREIAGEIDRVAQLGAAEVYIEIVAVPGLGQLRG